MTKAERLYEALIAEKERTITTLLEQVSFLRNQLQMRPFQEIDTQPEQSLPDFEQEIQMWVRDEEADLRDLVETGKLSKEEADAAFLELNEGITL